MRKTASVLLALLLLLPGCGNAVTEVRSPPEIIPAATQIGSTTTPGEEHLPLPGGSIKSIEVYPYLGSSHYIFIGEEAAAVFDYLTQLNVTSDFPENPGEYDGGGWDITIHYQRDHTLRLCHFGNMFIRIEAGPWYKMDYEEASYFSTLVSELAQRASTENNIPE